MLVATVLALASAGMHAGWNLVAKRSADRFAALWGQFAVGGIIGAVAIAVTRDLPVEAWGWAAITGAVHVPYIVALASAYDRGDFSLAYPVARGGGALLAGIGGIVLLDDELSLLGVVAIVTVSAGMVLLSIGAQASQVMTALVVAAMIGIYTTVDSHASRDVGGNTYVFAVFVSCALMVSVYGLAVGRGPSLRRSLPGSWRMFLLTGAVSVVTYGMVMLAVRRAPVGYVAALRESSVLVAAFIGWRYLDEGSAHRRLIAAGVVVAGLVLLVVAR
ncbi:MAG TPA: EamA family transporter [Ilumatobacteraceae bacterium]|nr:EamA family transporter [Ilumatobacteraceae bacterium]